MLGLERYEDVAILTAMLSIPAQQLGFHLSSPLLPCSRRCFRSRGAFMLLSCRLRTGSCQRFLSTSSREGVKNEGSGWLEVLQYSSPWFWSALEDLDVTETFLHRFMSEIQHF